MTKAMLLPHRSLGYKLSNRSTGPCEYFFFLRMNLVLFWPRSLRLDWAPRSYRVVSCPFGAWCDRLGRSDREEFRPKASSPRPLQRTERGGRGVKPGRVGGRQCWLVGWLGRLGQAVGRRAGEPRVRKWEGKKGRAGQHQHQHQHLGVVTWPVCRSQLQSPEESAAQNSVAGSGPVRREGRRELGSCGWCWVGQLKDSLGNRLAPGALGDGMDMDMDMDRAQGRGGGEERSKRRRTLFHRTE